MKILAFSSLVALLVAPVSVMAQAVKSNNASATDTIQQSVIAELNNIQIDEYIPVLSDYDDFDKYLNDIKPLLNAEDSMEIQELPRIFFMPAVYNGYEFPESTDIFAKDYSGASHMLWLERSQALKRQKDRISEYMFYSHPEVVPYNYTLLPEAPERFMSSVRPEDYSVDVALPTASAIETSFDVAPVKRRHWIRSFSASLQFSQAYVSPNWYQGGNNNLNALANVLYNVKLNQEFHPDILFETTVQYKLGLNNAPEDTIHSYNISDDLFQVNTTFGIKAAKRWYYSFTGLFKTQLLNFYKTNSTVMRSAFMSPGELTVGLGMTYSYATPSKNFSFDASIAPLSYNLKTCISNSIDPTLHDIEVGRKTSSQIGSSCDLKVVWKIAYNISLNSRLTAFTDYSSAYASWENTINFEINRFLSTQLYLHARYDSATPECDDPNWHKLQLKEILSIGFSYKFSSI